MPSKRKSSACVDYVPALCTHRPSLLPIEWLSEAFGLTRGGRQRPPWDGKLSKLGHLEEVKVVTRSPLVNQRRDHYKKPKGCFKPSRTLPTLPRRAGVLPGGAPRAPVRLGGPASARRGPQTLSLCRISE